MISRTDSLVMQSIVQLYIRLLFFLFFVCDYLFEPVSGI
jgi:hypothetical protein